MPSYAVTGASRGLGLGYVRALSAAKENTVFALVRDVANATELNAFIKANNASNVHSVQLDLNDLGSIKTAAEEISKLTGGKLDVLINNGALMLPDRMRVTVDQFPDEETLEKDLVTYFKTNVVGTTHVINAFLPLIRAGNLKKIIIISSAMGSPKYAFETGSSGTVPYATSKAALNMLVVKFALSVKDVIFLAVTPGLVKTASGPKEVVDKLYDSIVAQHRLKFPNYKGAVTVDESVGQQLVLFDRITLEDSGRFVHRDGSDGDIHVDI